MSKKTQRFQPTTEIIIDSVEQPTVPTIDLHADYSVFDVATAEAMKSHARRIKAKAHKIGAEMIDIGGELAAAKERVEHGQWLNWLRDELAMTDTAAQRLIAVHREFHHQRHLASLFTPRVLELMAGRKTPPAARQQIIDQTQTTGQSPTVRQAAAIIQQHKTPNAATLQHLVTSKSAANLMPPQQSTPSLLAETPAWALQNHILTWFDDYARADHRPFASVLIDLHDRKPPAWPSFQAYVLASNLRYTEQDLTIALNGATVSLRQLQNPSQTTAPRFISLAETTALIWTVISQAASLNGDHSDPDTLFSALHSRRQAADYTDSLPIGLVISNQTFQHAWAAVNAALRGDNTQQPLPVTAPPPSASPITVTLRLEPTQFQIFKEHLQSGSLANLPPLIIAELNEQIQLPVYP